MQVRRIGRRALIAIAILAVVALLGTALVRFWWARHGAGWTHDPEDAAWVLPAASQQLIERAFADADDRPVLDRRALIVSRGQLSGPGFSNDSRAHGRAGPSIAVWLSRRLRDEAAGVVRPETADADYVSRLVRQIRAMPGPYRARIMARDGVFDDQGAPRVDNAEPTVANDYVAWLGQRVAPVLKPVVSIHPQRPDADQALTKWAAKGGDEVVWWPVRQRIDPTGAAAKAAYKIMAEHDMRLIISVGQLHNADGENRWIAPSAIRPALKAGVSVRLRLGRATGSEDQNLMPALFRLLRETGDNEVDLTVSLAGLLTGDRPGTELEPLLEHPQFFARLRYASGYPRIARAGAIDLDRLAAEGFIARADVAPLAAIYDVNPLLFTFVVMRHVHLPGTGLALPGTVFFGSASDSD